MPSCVMLGCERDVARVLAAAPALRAALEVVSELRLSQGCIAAGMVRNAVWDVLHGRAPALHPRSDVDVIYFDRQELSPERDQQLEHTLAKLRPDVPWQVRNQARMHARNDDPPYASARDALRYFPETATALSARMDGEHVIVEAPLGLHDLFALVVRPTPQFERKADIYRARLAGKDWGERWPRLRFQEPPSWKR